MHPPEKAADIGKTLIRTILMRKVNAVLSVGALAPPIPTPIPAASVPWDLPALMH
jgi:hypothetical protein